MGVADSIGVIVDVHLFDVGFTFLKVEMLDVKLLAAVNVDGLFVNEGQGAGKIDFADDVGRAGDVDDHKIVAGHRAEADGIGGIGFMGPVVIIASQMKKACLREARAKIGQIGVAKFFVWLDGQFERGAFQMIDQDFEIVGLYEGVLGSITEKIIRMAHDELIERRRRSYQHGAGASTAASRASGPLPRGGDSAGVSGHDDGIERADIDAQFESTGRNDAANFSIA